ncbi:SRPBCC domain-containing protein [Candidatus Uhrbacteria bacterium]|nr:MAG: SRPBCC domain-containing protein [Candidatus Uhrbacteria bacterium]
MNRTTPYAESDARNGGKFKIGFKSPDGKNDFDFEGVYNELVEPERIVYTIADGRPVTIVLSDEGGKTKVSLTLTLEDENSAEQQREGWGLMLKHLGEYLECS